MLWSLSALIVALLTLSQAGGRGGIAAADMAGGVLDPAAAYTASYPVACESSLDPTVLDPTGLNLTGNATTSVGGGTFDLNALLGADRYYDYTT